MKIREIEIKNYKCHEKTTIPTSSNLHTFVGPNSAGKTSIIEACELTKSLSNSVGYGHIVYGGISKEITLRIVMIKFIVELTPDERNHYFLNYFFLSSELTEEPTTTKILTRVSLCDWK
jgi:Fe-S cluster assembly ATPase SufC